MKNYRVSIVDNDPHVREMLVETLRFLNFEVIGYEEAEMLLYDMFEPSLLRQASPDLIVVDLQLNENKKQGLELITELAERNLPSSILAISENHPSGDLEAAMRIGAAAIVPKPFLNLPQLVFQMEHLAHIGQKVRARTNANGTQRKLDPTRRDRPVFLSYSHKDKVFANGIRRTIEGRNIGVWYDVASLKVGDHYVEEIEQGIDESSIFIPLITDNYLNSNACKGELVRFIKREQSSRNGELLLLPLIDGVSPANKRDSLLRPVLERYLCLDLSQRFIDQITVLLGRIDLRLMQEKKRKPQKVRAASVSSTH